MDSELYLEVLRDDPTPFKSFVSRGDVPDEIDVPGPRLEAEIVINHAISIVRSTQIPRIVPVIGEAGIGKTHLYWALKKKRENNAFVVYVPGPPNPAKVYLHFYTCLMDEYGPKILKNTSTNILKSLGFKNEGDCDLKKVLTTAVRNFPGVYLSLIHI